MDTQCVDNGWLKNVVKKRNIFFDNFGEIWAIFSNFLQHSQGYQPKTMFSICPYWHQYIDTIFTFLRAFALKLQHVEI